jgi:S-disulfanyl-L-cysteine oxidoreductase SoxD
MTRRLLRSPIGALSIAMLLAGGALRAGQQPSAAPRVYTEAQASRGEALFKENCAFCHGGELGGTLSGPAIDANALSTRWLSRPLSDLVTYVQVFMPWNSPGGLTPQQNADIVAFMLKRAGFPSGAAELSENAALQNKIVLAPAATPR